MKRTTRNAAKTKQEIIEKSAPVFNQYGYAGTKMQMIIDATGYKMGGVYRHFSTKNDLAKAAFEYNFNLLKKAYYEGVNSEKPPKEQLLTLIGNCQKMIISSDMQSGCPILNTAIEVDDTDETFRLLAVAGLDDLLLRLENILEAGKKSGDFQANIQPKQEAVYLTATIEGAIMIGKLKKSGSVMRSIYKSLFLYIEKQVLKGK